MSVGDRSGEGALNKSILSGGTLSGVTVPSPTATESGSPVPTDSPTVAPIATGRDLFPEAVDWKTVDCEWPSSSFTEDMRIRQIWTVRDGQGISGIGIYCQSYSGDAGMAERFPRSSIRFVSQFPDDSPTGSGGGRGTGLPGTGRGFGTGTTLPSDGSPGTGFETGDDDDDPFDEGLGSPFERPTFTPGGGTTGGGGGGPGGDTTGGDSGGSSGTPTATFTPVPLSGDDVTWLDGTDPGAGVVESRNEEGLDPVAFLMSPEGSVVAFGSACPDSESISCSGIETVYETYCADGSPIRGLSVGFDHDGVIAGVVARRKVLRVLGSDCEVRVKPTVSRAWLHSLQQLWN